jgi:hypothetical protein
MEEFLTSKGKALFLFDYETFQLFTAVLAKKADNSYNAQDKRTKSKAKYRNSVSHIVKDDIKQRTSTTQVNSEGPLKVIVSPQGFTEIFSSFIDDSVFDKYDSDSGENNAMNNLDINFIILSLQMKMLLLMLLQLPRKSVLLLLLSVLLLLLLLLLSVRNTSVI